MLDLDQIIATASDPNRLLNFSMTRHIEENAVTCVFKFENGDRALPAPADGKSAEAVIAEDGALAYVMCHTDGSVLIAAVTHTVDMYLGVHPLSDVECDGSA